MEAIIEAVEAEVVEEEVIDLTMMVMVADKKEEEDVAIVVDTTTSTSHLTEVQAMTETSEEVDTKKKLAIRSDREIENVAVTQMQEPTNELAQRRKC